MLTSHAIVQRSEVATAAWCGVRGYQPISPVDSVCQAFDGITVGIPGTAPAVQQLHEMLRNRPGVLVVPLPIVAEQPA